MTAVLRRVNGRYEREVEEVLDARGRVPDEPVVRVDEVDLLLEQDLGRPLEDAHVELHHPRDQLVEGNHRRILAHADDVHAVEFLLGGSVRVVAGDDVDGVAGLGEGERQAVDVLAQAADDARRVFPRKDEDPHKPAPEVGESCHARPLPGKTVGVRTASRHRGSP
jgi:hypothetical protein